MNAPALYSYAPLLAERLSAAEVRYVLQEKGDPATPVFLIRLGGSGGTLLLSLARDFPALIHLPEGASPQGMKSAESQALERILTGLRATGAVVEPVDRAITLQWPPVTMRIDLVPGRAAVTLEEGGKELLRLPAAKKGERRRSPRRAKGAQEPNAPEKTEKTDLLHFDPDGPDGLPALCTGAGTDDEAQVDSVRLAICRSIISVPPEWIDELSHQARGGKAYAETWRDMVARLRPAAGEGSPGWLYRRRGELILSPIPLDHLEPEKRFDSLDAAAVEFWQARHDEQARNSAAGRLLRAVRPERKRLARLVKRLEKDRTEAQMAPLFRRKGEILSIHFRAVKKGAESIRLPDPYDGNEIEIELDPSKGAKDNIDRYFRRGAKGERALPQIEQRLKEAQRSVAALEEIEARGRAAAGAEEADRLYEEARPHFKPEPKEPEWRKRIKKPADKRSGARPREYQVAGGYTVLAGKDNKENDFLTFKIAGQRDIWFHVSQSAGSHVVLLKKDPKENPPREALLAAAAIAAHHSKSKHGGRVAVIYTERRFVRKPRGAPPGQVTCTREKTLFVDPGLPGDSS